MPTDGQRQRLLQDFADFARRHAEQADVAEAFAALLREPGDAFVRTRCDAHFTGSAFVVSRDGRRTLLLHHRKLDRWLQPGGHADGDADLAAVALREAEEETGLRDLRVEATPFDLDRHRIPERGDEPAHWHYDVRYVVRCGEAEDFVVNAESLALAWRDIGDVAADVAVDASVRRMAQRWLSLSG